MTAIAVAAVTGVFGLLGELLRREGKRAVAEAEAAEAHTSMAAVLRRVREDVADLRATVRAVADRVEHLDRRLDKHLDG